MTRQRKKAINQEIDRNMKRAFEELLQEPVPDRFADLIERLRQEETTPPGSGAEDISDTGNSSTDT
ncbi:NepR family anti-sigma factor [Tateyamaria pelophila]|uniref:NepR family anti-sigma factor n=1 Tax=Tateyamaria pelophila TaxID=328415 RepID=UPI001CBEAC67|nr:NepR family anti-sigma factor [Tateyamaria pelophila]